MKKIWILLTLIGLIGTALSSCLPEHWETSTMEAPTSVMVSPTMEEGESAQTPTATPKLTVASLPSPTRVPTFTEEEARAYFQNIYKDNGGCELPCWWGITPGVSSEEEMILIFSKLDSPRIIQYENDLGEKVTKYQYSFEVPVNEKFPLVEYFDPIFWIINSKVEFIGINALYVSEDFDFSLARILQTFGTSSEIWIKPTVYDWETPYFITDLSYFNFGISIGLANYFKVDGKELSICLSDEQNDFMYLPADLLLFSPEEEYTFEKIAERTLLFEPNEYYLLDDIAFGYSVEDFYNQFSVSGTNQCIAMDESMFVKLDE